MIATTSTVVQDAIRTYKSYICHETQAIQLAIQDAADNTTACEPTQTIEIDANTLYIVVNKRTA